MYVCKNVLVVKLCMIVCMYVCIDVCVCMYVCVHVCLSCSFIFTYQISNGEHFCPCVKLEGGYVPHLKDYFEHYLTEIEKTTHYSNHQVGYLTDTTIFAIKIKINSTKTLCYLLVWSLKYTQFYQYIIKHTYFAVKIE